MSGVEDSAATSTLRLIARLASDLAREIEPHTDTEMQMASAQVTGERSAFRFTASTDQGSRDSDVDRTAAVKRTTRPPLPDPRLVRQLIRQRQLRARFFDGDLFADPAWDMLLDLAAARVEHTRVSVTSLCIASGVPPTTALRWIGEMTEAGLLARTEDEIDRRRAFITLTDRSADAMARYFAALGPSSAILI